MSKHKKHETPADEPPRLAEAPSAEEAKPVEMKEGWTATLLWFQPSAGRVGVRYSLNGRHMFCTILRKELLEQALGGWEGMDKIPWTDSPPLGWDAKQPVPASTEHAHPHKRKEG